MTMRFFLIISPAISFLLVTNGSNALKVPFRPLLARNRRDKCKVKTLPQDASMFSFNIMRWVVGGV